MVSTSEQMQVPNGTGPGVRRSKRPLFASRTRCKCPVTSKMEIRSSSVTMSRLGEMSDQWRVLLLMIMSQNVM